ncbi:hypothetical protein Bbelb_208370 [Branchiostoma belcheri]|nr:hypothetical protein Bbelb_208370 [Branchiostoma belcheri]
MAASTAQTGLVAMDQRLYVDEELYPVMTTRFDCCARYYIVFRFGSFFVTFGSRSKASRLNKQAEHDQRYLFEAVCDANPLLQLVFPDEFVDCLALLTFAIEERAHDSSRCTTRVTNEMIAIGHTPSRDYKSSGEFPGT